MADDKKETQTPFQIIEAAPDCREPTPYVPGPGDKAPYLVFGFDLGISSCGWCVLDKANNRVVALNSRLFDAPQLPKTGQSKAAARGAFRRARRTNDRRQARRRHAIACMVDAGLLPQGASGASLQTRKGERHPIALRAAGLDEPLSDRELAQALYSIAGHRGYIPHGEGKADKEAGKLLAAVKANSASLAAGGYRTVGEMFAAQGRSRNRKGGYELCATNAELIAEARLLISTQRRLGNPKCTQAFADRLEKESLSYLTDLSAVEKSAYAKVKGCTYFADAGLKAAPDCAPSSEMCRAWEKLTHLRTVSAGGFESPLPAPVVERAVRTLFSPSPIRGNKACRVTYKALRKWMDLPSTASFKGVSAEREDREPFCPKAWRAMREALPEATMRRLADERELADAVACAAAYSRSKSTFESLLFRNERTPQVQGTEALRRLAAQDAEAIAAALPYSSKSFSGYGRRSLRALDLIIGAFEEGAGGLHKAEEAVGLYAKRTQERSRARFLAPYESFDPTCSNPVVLRAMSQLRRVYNAMVSTYGLPAEVHIELARELKLGKAKRDEISKSQNAARKRREEDRKLVAAMLGCAEGDVTGKQLLIEELYAQQEGIDLYTGQPIDHARALGEHGYAQVDHILPYSRTCDDSKANKVLCLASSNQDKGARSPLEWLCGAESEAFAGRVLAAFSAKRISYGKRERLLCADLAVKQDGFLSRNLNDTAYLCRNAAEWIRESAEFAAGERKQRVICPQGRVTAMLRRAWGLPAKDRSDERHHAADAAVIAAADQGTVMRAAKASAARKAAPRADSARIAASAQPWPGFSNQVAEALSRAVPVHAQDHKVGGAVLEATVYRFLGRDDKGLARLRAGGKEVKPSGNCVVSPDGKSVKKLGDQAFLQLWWDPELKVRGRREPGGWLADPVFVFDVPALARGEYVPRFAKQGVPRNRWQPVPQRCLAQAPLRLFPGDLLDTGGVFRRYSTYGIGQANWQLQSAFQNVAKDLRKEELRVATKGYPISGSTRGGIKVLTPSVLGWPGYIA